MHIVASNIKVGINFTKNLIMNTEIFILMLTLTSFLCEREYLNSNVRLRFLPILAFVVLCFLHLISCFSYKYSLR